MGGEAWWAAVYGIAKSRTRLSNFTFTFHFHALEKEMATHWTLALCQKLSPKTVQVLLSRLTFIVSLSNYCNYYHLEMKIVGVGKVTSSERVLLTTWLSRSVQSRRADTAWAWADRAPGERPVCSRTWNVMMESSIWAAWGQIWVRGGPSASSDLHAATWRFPHRDAASTASHYCPLPPARLEAQAGPAHLCPPGRNWSGADGWGPGPGPLAAATTTPGLPSPAPAAPHNPGKKTSTALHFPHASLCPHFPSHTSGLPLLPSLSLGPQAMPGCLA